MSLYTSPRAGTKVYRTKLPMKDIHRQFDMTYGEVLPVMAKFVLPGDVWKINAGALIRYKKMLSPTLTKSDAYFRFFFVPLRQVEDKTEDVITGSKNGALIESSLPVFKNYVQEYEDISGSTLYVSKNSFWPMLGQHPLEVVQFQNTYNNKTRYKYGVTSMLNRSNDNSLPAAYWYKAYCKIIFEYFRDETYQSFDGDFTKFYEYMVCNKYASDVDQNGWYVRSTNNSSAFYNVVQYDFKTAKYQDANDETKTTEIRNGLLDFKVWFASLRKDYFMSTMPWIMKGVQPTINSVMHADFTNVVGASDNGHLVGLSGDSKVLGLYNGPNSGSLSLNGANVLQNSSSNAISLSGSNSLVTALNKNQITDGGFSAQDIRDMFAETRIFERMARCGSRYVEYLDSNFGIAPRDDTLQRPLYLGGFSQPIVTTEVVQTGGDSADIGTLRGHGISSYSNKLRPFVATEFGMIFGLMYVTPKTEYTYQNRAEYSYKSRFDFFNPSFQLLSEKQVKKSEMFQPVEKLTMSWASGVPSDITRTPYTDGVLGYNSMYQELRTDQDMVLRSIADNESYWTQAINPDENFNSSAGSRDTRTSRFDTLSLNGSSICIGSWLPSLLRPFESTDPAFKPMIVDFYNNTSVFRPMVKNPVPGLTDHF